jgi:hypothetical protein
VTFDAFVNVVGGDEPPFPAWRTFLTTPEARGMSRHERTALRTVYWPDGREPTLESYAMMLAALRDTTRPRTR